MNKRPDNRLLKITKDVLPRSLPINFTLIVILYLMYFGVSGFLLYTIIFILAIWWMAVIYDYQNHKFIDPMNKYNNDAFPYDAFLSDNNLIDPDHPGVIPQNRDDFEERLRNNEPLN